MNKFYFFLFLVLTTTSQAQQFSLKKGVVIDKVAMVTDSTATYSIYLPEAFEMNKKWPLLFAFDPEGNGKRAVNVFKEAAEKYGLIVVSSNVIKNDVLEKNLAKFDKLSIEIAKTYPLQTTRIFTAGFSGGARLATTIAVITKKIEAVIACGASFSTNVNYYPNKHKFYFVGMAGNDDFNYIEMESAQQYLNTKRIPNEFFTFDGAHEWPDQQLVTEAFQWIQLRYHKKYNKISKEELIEKYQTEIEKANKLSTYNKEKAIEQFTRIQTNFHVPLNTDSLKKNIRLLKKGQAYKTRKKKDREATWEEEDLRSMYALYFRDDLDSLNFDNLGWWESQLKQIDSFTKSKDYFKKRTGKRLKGLLATAAKEVAMTQKDSTDTQKWLYATIFRTLADKEDIQAYFDVIQYAAKKLDYDMALFYTEELFKNGFKDLKTLKTIPNASIFFVCPPYLELEEIYFGEPLDNTE
ncbi:hypothetical protein [Ascidiimonas sp. W6]|uniref:hypothetical protein n=1 Tax=Ascidiimonas meishanensis TaxID=3128903 RepID=UPI0030EBDECC